MITATSLYFRVSIVSIVSIKTDIKKIWRARRSPGRKRAKYVRKRPVLDRARSPEGTERCQETKDSEEVCVISSTADDQIEELKSEDTDTTVRCVSRWYLVALRLWISQRRPGTPEGNLLRKSEETAGFTFYLVNSKEPKVRLTV